MTNMANPLCLARRTFIMVICGLITYALGGWSTLRVITVVPDIMSFVLQQPGWSG
jgi:hypothetical protein